MVVLEDGLPRPQAYRRFKLRIDANDDPAAMREVVRRRFERLLTDQAEPLDAESSRRRSFAYPPQLVIIDGGPMQLRAALEGVADLPVEGVAFVALAKRLEELWLPDRDRPVMLPRGSEALYLVQRVRDEAHRFAITYQRARRTGTPIGRRGYGAGAGMSDPLQDQVSPRPLVLIITGLSGAGRSTASDTLEDLGWYVIDNLPPALIGPVAELAAAPGSSVSRLCLVTDVRGREFFADLAGAISELRTSGADVRIVFLEADDEVLMRRFEETRRRHPADDGGGLLGGIANERRLMADLREQADLIVDTSEDTVHDLRDQIIDLLSGPAETGLQVTVMSFGFKRGTPREADLLFDVRFLPNPHWVEELRPLDGRDDDVRGQPMSGPFLDRLEDLLDVTLPGYLAERKRYLTIAIGCTGGKHRSVALADHIARHLDGRSGITVRTVHRDLGAE
jgi:UPF0042 nucleotide-binding protein